MSRLLDIPGHGKSLKNARHFRLFQKRTVLALELLSLPFQCLSNASPNLFFFCCKMPWGLLGPLGACLGLLGTLLGLPRGRFWSKNVPENLEIVTCMHDMPDMHA